MEPIILLPDDEYRLRIERLKESMESSALSSVLVSDNANKYYLTGRVFAGYIYVSINLPELFFVKRPSILEGDGVVYIRKPEQMAESIGMNVPESIGMELDSLTWSAVQRLKSIFGESELKNASPLLRQQRAVKTAFEIELLKKSGVKHEYVYRHIARLYRPGMSDLEFQVEIERLTRLEGCLGQFRIAGDSMELYMGNVLTGDNADSPSPYDFAMGGRGLDPSLPVGCDGSTIRRGTTVMVDMNGNFTGYMTDMTRTFALGNIAARAIEAHEVSRNIGCELAKACPGTEAKEMYEKAKTMAESAGLGKYFMGHMQKAGFIGHGVGIEVNELPVIAPKSRDIIREGNVIALEPKFVIPGIGAVGIENTYVVGATGMECITNAPEEIIYLEE